jgi:hypothetical protein
MKPMNNPVVVGALVVIALIVVFRNALAPMWNKVRSYKRQPIAAAAPASPSAPATPVRTAAPVEKPLLTEKPPTLNSVSGAVMDLAVLRTNAVHWMDAPRRDPFIGRFAPGDRAGSYPSAMELLNLGGIWRQTDSSLAVINNQVLGEGEGILAFKVEAIEADGVWVSGPNGRERVFFKAGGASGTNQPPALSEGKPPPAESPAPR